MGTRTHIWDDDEAVGSWVPFNGLPLGGGHGHPSMQLEWSDKIYLPVSRLSIGPEQSFERRTGFSITSVS